MARTTTKLEIELPFRVPSKKVYCLYLHYGNGYKDKTHLPTFYWWGVDESRAQGVLVRLDKGKPEVRVTRWYSDEYGILADDVFQTKAEAEAEAARRNKAIGADKKLAEARAGHVITVYGGDPDSPEYKEALKTRRKRVKV